MKRKEKDICWRKCNGKLVDTLVELGALKMQSCRVFFKRIISEGGISPVNAPLDSAAADARREFALKALSLPLPLPFTPFLSLFPFNSLFLLTSLPSSCTLLSLSSAATFFIYLLYSSIYFIYSVAVGLSRKSVGRKRARER